MMMPGIFLNGGKKGKHTSAEHPSPGQVPSGIDHSRFHPAEFDVLKFRTDELNVSFLCYPDFLKRAHPTLFHAITIDLVTRKRQDKDCADNLNPAHGASLPGTFSIFLPTD